MVSENTGRGEGVGWLARGLLGVLVLLGIGLGAEWAWAVPAVASGGYYHSMAILEDGSLWGWGGVVLDR